MTALSADKIRTYAADVPQMFAFLKCGGTVYAGSALESSSGQVVAVSGAGTFMGFAMEGGVSGDYIKVCVQGVIQLTITTETPNEDDIGDAAVTVEATDDDTFRIESAAAVTGTTIGKVYGVGGSVPSTALLCSFKAAMVA